ncbi:hypothetical protein AGMMS49573_10530 [Endomicrobiia bacterium]|uniref:hypothetical protein n=1 Tax=Endomicrobium trichonymphae TaxID=1408204 RepID=UPI000BAA41BE|nr:hypothetical protein [Candidatus Endomicrobium trichonymphae]GHT06289.1 hypothetical protein AGMMS49523_07570 [Endomicrobiia bacterium]GHT08774.1 hypothetical protein AGMMS49532_04750 [Endomicrobiia bacterium]GHT12385.1 hypothetical protein AGMMS49571_04250 [Endomicrobiia bacterium]GHT17950.1 hypothetical protein AGMMS49573_10530 [Endomicrobiia bacterium]GHT19977.1 hypothetical protein AGMMS49929_05070 [Endomicrobiia bacterium]
MKKLIAGALALMMFAGAAFSEGETWSQIELENAKKNPKSWTFIEYFKVVRSAYVSEAQEEEYPATTKKYIFVSTQIQDLIDHLRAAYANSSTVWKK